MKILTINDTNVKAQRAVELYLLSEEDEEMTTTEVFAKYAQLGDSEIQGVQIYGDDPTGGVFEESVYFAICDIYDYHDDQLSDDQHERLADIDAADAGFFD